MKARIALDVCKMAHKRGDVETKKRALASICMIYEIDPTELTDQGLGRSRSGISRDKEEQPYSPADVKAVATITLDSVALSPPSPDLLRDAQQFDDLMDELNRLIDEEK